MRPWTIAAAVVSLVLGIPLSVLGGGAGSLASVFQLVTMTREGKGVARGTAFFIDPSGLALTNSHVVSRVQRDPDHYVLFAFVGKEFYGAEIVCATPLSVDPLEVPTGPVARDIAEVRLTAPGPAFRWWRIVEPGDAPQVIATPHLGDLPRFPALALGDGPQEHGQIRVVGYGKSTEATEQTVAAGTVTRTANAQDGTPVFEIESPARPERGSSGSPVLDDQDRVVGMYTWNEIASDTVGIAISSQALATGCPQRGQPVSVSPGR
ncbi:MAG TPA: serine protease [bacterium]|nr:serine protease [bacterium]